MPIMIGFILFNDVLGPTDTILKFLMNILSRRFEFQAGEYHILPMEAFTNPLSDDFAVGLGYSRDLAKSLIKLQIQNLSTMDADWMYASYHFSHPILAERLGALGYYGEKVKDSKKEDSSKAVKAADREL